MRIQAQELEQLFYEILLSRDVSDDIALLAAKNFTSTSLDGVYSHGVNRFPRIVSYLDKKVIDGKARAECVASFGCSERWDGNLGMGNVNAMRAMDRACELAKQSGIGIVSIGNTNHWLRGGSYGWQAADNGCIGICWTNTMPNTCAWGGKEPRIGNNPIIMSVPKSDGRHVVVDCAMSQFAFGKVEMARMKGETLPVPGGWDTNGNITCNPAEIEKSNRMLPIGYWKGSGLSILLDVIAASLSGGNTVTDIGRKYTDEIALSQVLIAINPYAFGGSSFTDNVLENVICDIKTATPSQPDGKIYYPGELEYLTRADNLKNGIPVLDNVWDSITALKR